MKKSKEKFKKYLKTNENGNTTEQNVAFSKCSSKREVHSDVYHKKQEKSNINNLTLQPQETRKGCRCMNTLNVHLYLEQFHLRDN